MKKMKKSAAGSMKRQEVCVKQPGKPIPAPNYVKSTTSSSSYARKEVISTKISPPLAVAPHHNSTLRRKIPNNTKLTLAPSANNNNKATKTMRRTLTKKKNHSFKPARCTGQSATCSSTLKDSKFPVYLSLNHDVDGGTQSQGTSIIQVCPYTYCSLNGGHASLPPIPLKCFLSARRHMIKAQSDIKLGCLLPTPVTSVNFGDGHKLDEKIDDDSESARISPLTEHECGDFFIDEIFSNKNENNSGIDEIAAEDQEEKLVDNNETLDQEGDIKVFSPVLVQEETKQGILSELSVESMGDVQLDEQDLDDEFIFKTDDKSRGFDEFSVDEEVSQESFDDDEESFNSGAFSIFDDDDNDSESTDSYDYTQSLNNIKTSKPADGCHHQVQTELSDAEKNQENSTESFINSSPIDDQAEEHHPEVAQLKYNKFRVENKAKTETDDSALVLAITNKRKKPTEYTDESGPFNPRAPNFLPLEPDPEAEKVDLKHQDLDERKNTEEWMVDYALRQVVTKLDRPDRKRKVALLVEAFEKVMPIKKCELNLRHTSAFFFGIL